jgi:glycosyltransferase involved in cell wall biosynthesis
MALYGDLDYDSRVLREARTLAQAGHRVTVYCLDGSQPDDGSFEVAASLPKGEVLPLGRSPYLADRFSGRARAVIGRTRWLLGYASAVRVWGRWAAGQAGDVDVWHAHDLPGLLAVGPSIRRPAGLVYDSHEIYLETGTATRLPRPIRRALGWFEARLARTAVALVTVNEGYAGVLGARLRPRRIEIVRNCPPRRASTPKAASPLRAAIGVDVSTPVALYHGVFSSGRGIEQAIDAMAEPGLGAVHLAILGFGPLESALRERSRRADVDGRVHVLEGVAPAALLDWVAGADVNVVALQASNLNHFHCTPNKLWESIAAGVPVVVSDFPEMRKVVLEGPEAPLGATCDPVDPASIAAAIHAIIESPSAEQDAMRARCLAAAYARWNWESEATRLTQLYADISTSRAA